MQELIGRKNEVKILNHLLTSKEAEFAAVYGRRRVGKTFLIRNIINSKKHLIFELTGVKNGSLREQLSNFIDALATTFHTSLINQKIKNWNSAFSLLTQEIKRLPKNKTMVIFFDELPWLATKRSRLIQHLDHFWNQHWSNMPQIKLIVCGSAAAWMLEKLIHAKGGLYNRITKAILLEPFNLAETKQFLLSRNIKLTHAQILDLYIALGGIPHYLKQIEPGKSAVQNINQSCFTKQGALFNEFSQLFESLFDKTGHHLKVVCTIAKTRNGISRNDLLQATKLNSGGIFNKLLNELEASGFVQKFIPYGKSIKEHYFRIIDEYTMFYLKWIAPIKTKSIALRSNYWHTKSKSAAWQSWAGYTFENICYKHINQIANKLNLMNISCIVSSWRYVPKIGSMQRGAQIDLLFDRDDQSITICEIKYNDSDFVINKQYALDILEKNRIFAEQINTKKQLFICFITKNKLKDNIWKQEIVNDVVTLDDLFTT